MAKTLAQQIQDLKEERNRLIVAATEGKSTPEETGRAMRLAQASDEVYEVEQQIAALRQKQAENN